MGSIFRRGDSKFYWIAYYYNGKQLRESTKSESEDYAKRLLKLREGEIAQGKEPAALFYDKVLFKDLLEDLATDYRINQRKSLRTIGGIIDLLMKELGEYKAARLDTARIKAFVNKRLEEGRANATINRELAAIKRAYNLAAQNTPPKVATVPYIPMLKENNARKGFFEQDEFLKLRAALPTYLRPVATFAYTYGWRRGEIVNLTWDNVDFNQGVVRLDPGMAKNDQAREVYLNEECLRDISLLFATRNGCPHVFHRSGQGVGDFKKAWKSACKKAGLGGRLFHDLRRTAVRNLVRSGVPERVAMQITGHKTRAVFDRYNIVNKEDLRTAIERLGKYNNHKTIHVDLKMESEGLEKVGASA